MTEMMFGWVILAFLLGWLLSRVVQRRRWRQTYEHRLGMMDAAAMCEDMAKISDKIASDARAKFERDVAEGISRSLRLANQHIRARANHWST